MKSLDDMLWEYLEDRLTSDERRELDKAIRSDPSLAARLALFALQEVLLREMGGAASRRMPGSGRKRPGSVKRFSSWTAPLAAAASLLAALGIWLWLSRTSLETPVPYGVVARVESVRGTASGFSDATSAAKQWVLRVGDEIRAGMRIETGEESTVSLAWVSESTTVDVAGNSQLETRNSKLALLRQGQLSATVAQQPPNSPFAVETPHARAAVLGTRFRVEVRGETGNGKLETGGSISDNQSTINNRKSKIPPPSTWLHVEEGTVRFARLADQASVDVAAGEFAVAGENLTLKAYPTDTEWIEGPVIFQDNFQAGLAHWITGQVRVDVERMTGSDEPFTPEDGRHIGPATRRRDGRPVSGILMKSGVAQNVWPWIQIAKPVTAPAYSVEWDLAYITPGQAGPLFPGESAIDIVWTNEAIAKGAADFLSGTLLWWNTRLEIIPLVPPDPPYTVIRKAYQNGQMSSVNRADFDKEKVAFNILANPEKSSDIFIVRCLVRELIPVARLGAMADSE